MYSEAGRSYDKTRVISPFRTKERFRYYQLEPVKSNHKMPKHYQTLDSNLRNKKDSFFLRYAKDLTLNTDYSPDYQFGKHASPRQSVPKGAFTRIIGDIKDEDYSRPLMENCNHRCAEANGIISPKNPQISQVESQSQLPMVSLKSEKNMASLTTMTPLNISNNNLEMSEFKSTEQSLIKKRSKITLDSERPIGERVRGVSFDSSVGHRYLNQVDKRDKLPEFYDIQKSNQSIIRRSFKKPANYIKFGQFRDSIPTRYDRPDPHWHLIIDNSNQQMKQKDLSYDFSMHSQRKINEVKSKYPLRQCMNHYVLPHLHPQSIRS